MVVLTNSSGDTTCTSEQVPTELDMLKLIHGIMVVVMALLSQANLRSMERLQHV